MSDWFRERRRPFCLKRSELVVASFLLCCVCACTVFYLLPAVVADQHSSSPLVLELRLEGVVDPILATYIDEGLADAANRHAALVLITMDRSEEHTSELQSQSNLVCRLLLEKKKKKEEPKQNL